jgi:VanZ family protein
MGSPQRPTAHAAPTAAHFSWAAAGILALTVYGSLLPFRYTPHTFDEAAAVFRQMPWLDTADLAARGDWIVSSAQFAILGFLFMGAICVDRPGRAVPVALAVALSCAALAVGLEFAQIYFPPRTVSLNDIVMESAGAAAGVLAWLAAGQSITDWARRVGNTTSEASLANRVLPAYLAGLLVVQLMPFDFIGPAGVAAKFAEDKAVYDKAARLQAEGRYAEALEVARQAKVRLVPFAGLYHTEAHDLLHTALNIAAFAPLGLLRALGVRRRFAGRRPPLPWVAILAVPAGIEVLQLFVYSRYFDATDVLTGAAGVWAGWRLGRAWRRRLHTPGPAAAPPGRFVTAALLLAWAAVVACSFWQPFDFTTDPTKFVNEPDELPVHGLRRMTFAPFVDYYWGNKYNALVNFEQKALAFVPLGVILAWRQREVFRRGAATRVVVTAVVLAAVLEAGRYFLPEHGPSVTDVLIAAAGAWLGFRLTQKVRAVMWAETALYGWRHPSGAVFVSFESFPTSPRRPPFPRRFMP